MRGLVGLRLQDGRGCRNGRSWRLLAPSQDGLEIVVAGTEVPTSSSLQSLRIEAAWTHIFKSNEKSDGWNNLATQRAAVNGLSGLEKRLFSLSLTRTLELLLKVNI